MATLLLFLPSSKMLLSKNRWISSLLKTNIQHLSPYFSTDNSNVENDKITRPKYIKRSPTDLLKALASTVERDPTAPHYKYVDDPFFIPVSNSAKRVFSLSKESGRKAARYIIENFPEPFSAYEAEPNAFELPETLKNADMESEETLRKCIENLAVKPAIEVYNNICKSGKSLSINVEQELLELLCFYNCSDPSTNNFVDEKWFSQASKVKFQRTWLVKSPAEEIFDKIEDKNACSYGALICGMAKYLNVNKAFSLFQEMQDKNMIIDVEVYNAILKITPFLKESVELRWKLVEEILKHMNDSGVKPNLKTFNTLLMVVSKSHALRQIQSLALRILSEMKYCNIEPSLATFYYLLLINKKFSSGTFIFEAVLNYLEGKNLEIKDEDDVHFFNAAMDCCNFYSDIHLAYRVNDLLCEGNNRIILSDSFKESIYYKNFFKLLIQTEEIEKIFEFYNDMIPQLYTPEPMIMRELINVVDICAAYQHIPRLWSDIVIFHHDVHDIVLQDLTNVMINAPASKENKDTFATIAWDMKERLGILVERKERMLRKYPAVLLCDIIQLLLRANQFDKAWEVLLVFNNEPELINGIPSIEALKELVQVCIENKDAAKTLICLTKLTDLGSIDVISLADKADQVISFTEEQKYKIKALLSSKISQDNEQEFKAKVVSPDE